MLTHTDDEICNFPLFPGDHWHGIARHVLAKQASRSERAGVFFFSLFHFHLGSLGEALGTYCLDMIPGTRFQGRGAQKQRVFGGVFGVLSLRGPADILDRASVQHISFPWSRQHGINWRWRTDLAFFSSFVYGGVQTKRDAGNGTVVTVADDDTACTLAHTHTKIDWRR